MIERPWRGRIRRGAIVEHLVRGPATVGEATRALTISKPAVSKHLSCSRRPGSRTAVVGRTHRRRLRPQAPGPAADWLELHRQAWEAKFDVIEEHLKGASCGSRAGSTRLGRDAHGRRPLHGR